MIFDYDPQRHDRIMGIALFILVIAVLAYVCLLGGPQ